MPGARSGAARFLFRRLRERQGGRAGHGPGTRGLRRGIPPGQEARPRREDLALGRSLPGRFRERLQARHGGLHLGRALRLRRGPLRGRLRERQAQRLRRLLVGERRQLRRAVEGGRGGGARDADDDRKIPGDERVAGRHGKARRRAVPRVDRGTRDRGMDRGRNARGRPERAQGPGAGHQARRETGVRGRDAARPRRRRLGRSAQLDSLQVTPAYRYRRIWFLLGWGMVVAVVVLSLIPLEVDLGHGRDKLAHLAAYSGLSFWFGMLIEGRGRELRIAAAFALLGVALEFLQGLTDYRTFEIADMVANATGAALGWGLAQTPLKGVLGWMERLIAAASRGRAP